MSTAEHSYEGVLAKIFEYLEEHRNERPSTTITPHGPSGLITAQSQMIRDLGLDSLQSFEMLSDLEDHYGVTIPMDLFQDAVTLEDVARAVLRVLQGGEAA